MSTKTTTAGDNDSVTCDGITLNKSDIRGALNKIAAKEKITPEQAWELVRSDVRLFMETGKIAKDFGKISADRVKNTVQENFFIEGDPEIETTLTVLPTAPTLNTASLSVSSQTINLAAPQSTNAFFDDNQLPEHLKKQGVSMMTALANGLVSIPGEHPDAKLLRDSIAESQSLDGNDNLDDKPAIKAIKERQLSFPFQNSSVRIISTDFNQTSLFHVASNNTKRKIYKGEMMGRIGESVQIHFQGEELRHDDEAYFLQLLHLARGKAPYDWIYADTVPFMRSSRGARRILGQSDTESIDKSLLRMRSAVVIVKSTKRRSFITLNLISDLQGAGSTRRLMLDPRIVALLDSYTTMDAELLLEVSGVERQLYKYLSTIPYGQLYPTKIISYFEICYGTIESNTAQYMALNPDKTEEQVKVAMGKRISDFRRKTLPTSLKNLQDRGVIIEYTVDLKEDKVSIKKQAIISNHNDPAAPN